jgi:hypothetical protein
MGVIRRAACAAVLLLMVLPSALLGYSASNTDYGIHMRQTLTIYYTVQSSCYDLDSMTGTWVRYTTYSHVGVATAYLGWFGAKCSDGTVVAMNPSYDMTPSTWINNTATRSRSLSLPPIYLANPDIAVGVKLTGTDIYRNHYTETLCTQVLLNGGPGC